ncbi:MAG: protoheme IX farnesyltransferase [Verrucomicrobia bacterium]|nr:protoheme IX farnesyltransferase [Verrucomicrobiota bacterium]
MKEVVAEIIPVNATAEKSWVAVYCDLLKARLTFLVLLTTAVGFYLASRGSVDSLLMFHTLLGTALLASGASALNQLLERQHDAKMTRTETRPLPSGRLKPETVLIFGGVCAVAGMIYLALAVNTLTSLLGAVTLVSYVFVYTPLKRVTSLNTAIGAIPGALPPLMGWTAVRNEVTAEGWALFAILFFWQLPHFLAIAWIYREDYAKAGYVMLPLRDPEGLRTSRQAVSHTLGLLPISLVPFLLKMVGLTYFFGALVLGLIFLWYAIRFSREVTVSRARQLFFVSIIYLPLLLVLMVFDKITN